MEACPELTSPLLRRPPLCLDPGGSIPRRPRHCSLSPLFGSGSRGPSHGSRVAAFTAREGGSDKRTGRETRWQRQEAAREGEGRRMMLCGVIMGNVEVILSLALIIKAPSITNEFLVREYTASSISEIRYSCSEDSIIKFVNDLQARISPPAKGTPLPVILLGKMP